MNFLAHLYLSKPTVPARVGNLLGDFARGLDTSAQPPEVLRGLQNHRRVDQLTDQHPAVVDARRYFSPQRRRFAGICLDVLFDHYLIRHWDQFSEQPLEPFLADCYQDLERGFVLMPPRMQQVMERMIDDDWLSSYESLENVNFALNRIAGRIRFRHRFDDPIEEIRPHYQHFEQVFLRLFPDLIDAVNSVQQRPQVTSP
ncbi:acyl carrier protein phosphodiesterase [Marinobacterium jannaschii]|uniref:acyl carrier protein phosphodiesterase n=1 Tax=Marinobacterium jannaschii TaxID=64970 RepID=UPI00048336F7|nr:ACP phosphodiesterase [Marinobacterium jannaschii]